MKAGQLRERPSTEFWEEQAKKPSKDQAGYRYARKRKEIKGKARQRNGTGGQAREG